MVAILFSNSKDEIFREFDYFSSNFLHIFCNEKRGCLWMVRYSLCQGGRRLIFASDKFCVCRQKFMLYCFTGMIFVSMAVVGDNGRPLSGDLAISGILSVAISFCPDGAAVVISSCDYNCCQREYGIRFRSWG